MTPARRYRRLFSLGRFGRSEAEAEMDREIESHLAMRVADLVRAGMDPDAARAEAIRRFGDMEVARVQLRDAARDRESALRSRDRLGAVIADLRYAARQVHRAPAFSILAILTLALGIGATTAMFTLVNAVLLRPLPFRQPEQLLALSGMDSARGNVPNVSSASWLDWQRATTIQTTIYSFPYRQSIIAGDSATRVSAVRVPANFFSVVGSRFRAGRSFTAADLAEGNRLVVISERLWRRLSNADPALAAPMRTEGQSYQIVGVVAQGQEFPAGVDVWITVVPRPGIPRVNVNWTAIGRLRPGVSIDRAHAEMTGIARGIRAADPGALYDYDVQMQPLATHIVGDASLYLALLMGVVVLVLIIVCANVAASALARGATRSREMAIRASVGAERARLIQQLLIEHVALGIIAGAIGMFLAWGATRGVIATWGDRIPRAAEIVIDARVFAFALGVSLLAGMIAGVIPAIRITRVSLSAMMMSGGRTSARGGRNLAGSSLVSLEIALALLLLTGAGLLIRSFRSVVGRDIGFDTNVATAEVALSGPTYATDTTRRYAYWNALLDAYRTIPGVQAAAVANWIPLGITGQSFIDVESNPATGLGAVYRAVSRDFFASLKMPVIRGRTFDATDRPTSGRVVVINRTMAERFWPNQSPLGLRVRARSMEDGRKPADWLTIVGVVGDVRTYGLETDARAEMYVFYEQVPAWSTSMTALVRGSVPAAGLLAEMRRRARDVDPRVAIDVGTLDERLRGTLSWRVMTMGLLTGFAGTALLLAALGIYGVLSYAVAQRTRELAVRAALGAGRGELLRLVFVEGMRVVIIGAVFGVVGAFWLTRFLETMLVDVPRMDPLTYAVAITVLFVAAVGAIVVPAWRATRLEPMIALQAE